MGSPYLPDLAQEPEAEPLDISQLLGSAQPQTPPQQGQAPAKGDAAKWIKLALIAPFLAKAGPHALTGFLQGFNQSRGQEQVFNERQRQTQAAEAARQQQAQSLESYRQQTLQGQQQTRQQALLKQYTDALNAATSPDEVQALRESYRQQAMGAGMRPGVFDTLAMAQPPDKLQGKRIAATWAKLPAESKQEALKNGWSLNVDGQNIPFDQWSAQVGGFTDPATGKPAVPAPKVDTPNTPEERMFAALQSGDTATAQLLEDAAARVSGARRKPEDEAMAAIQKQIAELRLENLQAAKTTQGLPPRTQRRVDALAKGFDSQAITKTTQIIAEAVTFANSLDINTKNPADDQALIYSFAKAMDPESVVREGEYATVQKYAQSWADQFGFTAARIFSNSPFLTPQARQNMKDTIQQKYLAKRGQYDNVRNEYARRINGMTGGQDGQDYLIDYGAAFPAASDQSPPAGGRVAKPGANPFRGK